MSAHNYVFYRDFFETNRLNLQHYLFREVFGYLLHPSIPTSNPNLRIADIGAGSCMWLSDLSHQLPSSVTLEALDISFDNAPPKEALPQNMTLRHWDIFSDVPEELVGAYYIINVARFAFVVLGDQIKGITTKLLKLLKPGGYLQWSDTDSGPSGFRIWKSSPDNKTEALEKLYDFCLVKPADPRFKTAWVSTLPETFRECGFEAVEGDIRQPKPETIMPLHQCNLVIQEKVAHERRGSDRADALINLLQEVHRETQAGSAWDFPRVLTVGRKPLK